MNYYLVTTVHHLTAQLFAISHRPWTSPESVLLCCGVILQYSRLATNWINFLHFSIPHCCQVLPRRQSWSFSLWLCEVVTSVKCPDIWTMLLFANWIEINLIQMDFFFCFFKDYHLFFLTTLFIFQVGLIISQYIFIFMVRTFCPWAKTTNCILI